jgi:hypothetical protein
MSDIPTFNASGIGNIQTNTNSIPNVGVVQNSIVPSLAPPVVVETQQSIIRGLAIPIIQAPNTAVPYPVINVPTQEEFDAAVRAEKKAQEDEKQEKSRGLPDSPAPPILPPQIQQVLPQENKSSENAILPVNTNLGVPVIEVPFIGQVPIPPREQVILAGTTATASVAAALIGKSLVEWMVKRLQPIFNQLFVRGKKLLNRDLTPYELQIYFAFQKKDNLKKITKLLAKEKKVEKLKQYKEFYKKNEQN